MYKLTTEVVAMVSVHVVVVCKRQRNEFKFRPQESHSRQQLLLSQDYFLTNGQNDSSFHLFVQLDPKTYFTNVDSCYKKGSSCSNGEEQHRKNIW